MRSTRSIYRLGVGIFAMLLVVGTIERVAAIVSAPAETSRLISVIVKLEDEPVATYRGSVGGLAATSRRVTGARRIDMHSRAVLAYRTHLAGRFASAERLIVSAIPGARILYRYDVVLGGLAVQISEAELGILEGLPGVQAVHTDELQPLETTHSPAFIGAPALWKKVGGQGDAGEGIIVGMLDSGIWPEHPSFSDPDPQGKPYVVPPGTRACEFSGGSNPGPPFACNGKIIGAYRIETTYDACATCPHPAEEFSSVRDANGHGTMTASIAAGNGGVQTEIAHLARGIASGIAPRAHLIIYKVSGPMGSFGSDAVAAIQQAILDGVDVINYSIRGRADPYTDSVSLAFRDAYAAGVFVAAGAGNDGPAADTVTSLGPWVTTVAASNQPRTFWSKVTLAASDGKKLKVAGVSVSDQVKPGLPLILASSVGDEFCTSATPDGAFTGMIVFCNVNSSTTVPLISFNVSQRGAAGLLLQNRNSLLSPVGADDTPWVPTVDLTLAAGTMVRDFMAAHTGVVVTLGKGAPKKIEGNVMVGFSSRGGPHLAFGVAKPDVTAPGQLILGGDTPQHQDPLKIDGGLFQINQGTSLSTPHVAGGAALLKQLHPGWTPGQIKSTLMTSASAKKLVKGDGVTPFDSFDAGSGRIDLKAARDPGLTFDVPVQDYVDHAGDLWNVNYPSLFLPMNAPDTLMIGRTAHGELAKDTTWKLTITSPPDLAIHVPSTLVVPAGGLAPFTITIDKSAVAAGQVRFATLELAAKGHVARFPITAVGSGPLPDLVVTEVTASSPVTIGGSITLAVTTQNIGSVSADAYLVIFRISADNTLSANDPSLLSTDGGNLYCSFTDLAPGVTSTCTGPVPFVLSTSIPPGTYHVFAVIQPSRQQVERDSTNDTGESAAITVSE
jgi:hypothetical protein